MDAKCHHEEGSSVKWLRQGEEGAVRHVYEFAPAVACSRFRLAQGRGWGSGKYRFKLKAAMCSWMTCGERNFQQPGSGRAALSVVVAVTAGDRRGRHLCALLSLAACCVNVAVTSSAGHWIPWLKNRAGLSRGCEKLMKRAVTLPLLLPFCSGRKRVLWFTVTCGIHVSC